MIRRILNVRSAVGLARLGIDQGLLFKVSDFPAAPTTYSFRG